MMIHGFGIARAQRGVQGMNTLNVTLKMTGWGVRFASNVFFTTTQT
jgi:hypothetical protein